MSDEAMSDEASSEVEIRWTAFGIPHIAAPSRDALAFGVGYAYARDNANLLADSVLTVRGVRALHLGPEAASPLRALTNLESDFFHRAVFDATACATAYKTHEPLAAGMLAAYARGVAHALDRHHGLLVAPYAEALAGAPITAEDLFLLLAQKASHTSSCAFARAILAACPPDEDAPEPPAPPAPDPEAGETRYLGSNAFALGRDLTGNATGLLVGNPHFPWNGPHRFYEMHLTIPGELDVMGASLPPFPVVNIGFNRDVAWTHTVSGSRRFAIYEIGLSDPRTCRIGHVREPMAVREVAVPVREGAGIALRRRRFYRTRYGPVIAIPQMGCRWTARRAYALHDAAAGRVGLVSQWLALNKARSVREVQAALATHRGALWLNTIAADRTGEVFFGDLTAVPDISRATRWLAAPSPLASFAAHAQNMIVLNGSAPRAAAAHSRGSIAPGNLGPDKLAPSNLAPLRPAARMPQAVRTDCVLNCNDSHWLVNAAAPLEGFPAYVGAERRPQGLRTRMAHHELSALLRRGEAPTADAFAQILFSNRNLAADLVLDDLLALGRRQPRLERPGREPFDLAPALAVLAAWDRREAPGSRGAVLFRELWQRLRIQRGLWRTPFHRRDPLNTPRNLATGGRRAGAVRAALAEAAEALTACGLPLDVPLSQVQRITAAGGAIPLPGGHGAAGVLNLVDFGPLRPGGYEDGDIQGTSYTQIVTWDDGRVRAKAILPTSQSSDPRSPHAFDQTRLFAQGLWVPMAFEEADILADPTLVRLKLTFDS